MSTAAIANSSATSTRSPTPNHHAGTDNGVRYCNRSAAATSTKQGPAPANIRRASEVNREQTAETPCRPSKAGATDKPPKVSIAAAQWM